MDYITYAERIGYAIEKINKKRCLIMNQEIVMIAFACNRKELDV